MATITMRAFTVVVSIRVYSCWPVVHIRWACVLIKAVEAVADIAGLNMLNDMPMAVSVAVTTVGVITVAAAMASATRRHHHGRGLRGCGGRWQPQVVSLL